MTSAIAGRPIIGSTAGAASIVVNLVEPGTLFLDYQNRLDLRLGKTFRFGRTKIQGFADIFNVFNAGTVLTRQPDLRRGGRERVADADDDHGRPLRAVRHAAEFLRVLEVLRF